MLTSFLEILGGFMTFAVITLLGQATKYLGKKFDFDLFYVTNIKPLMWTAIAGVIIAAVSVFAPQYSVFITQMTGDELEMDVDNMAYLFASAATMGTVLKSMFGKPTEEAKKEILYKKQ